VPRIRFVIDVPAAGRVAGDEADVPPSAAGLLVSTGRAVFTEPVLNEASQTGPARIDREAKGYLTK